jgi:DNA gyrase subunit A
VVAAILVDPEAQIMLITNTGVLIRTRVSEIREMGRATQGVTLISLDEGTKLSGLQQVAEAEAEGEGDAEGPADGADSDTNGEDGGAA